MAEAQRITTVGEIQEQCDYSVDTGEKSDLVVMGRRRNSPEPPSSGSGRSAKDLWKRALYAFKAKLSHSNTSIARLATIDDHISMLVSDRSISEFTGMIATVMVNGLEVPSQVQGGNNNEVSLNIDPPTGFAEVGTHEPTNMPITVSPVNLSQALWTVSLLTLIFDIATILYKPARGILFGNNKEAYYLILAIIFASGVIEACTAYWMSLSNITERRCFSVGRVVLCASIGPLVSVIAIGGFTFIAS